MSEEMKKETTAEEIKEDQAEETAAKETEETKEQEAACEEQEVPETEKEPEKKGFFGKKKEKKDKKDEQIADLTDRLKRQIAEFDNYRKRTEKEKAGMYMVGAKEIVEKILPVVDNFERGLAGVPDEQLMTTLEGMGVKAIEAVGAEFDPDFHNAVMHVEDESVGENIVVEEFQKGYMYKEFVVRHSMVKVAN